MTRDKTIEAAKAYEAEYHANPNDGRFYSDLMADFHLSERSKLLAEIRSRVEAITSVRWNISRDEMLGILDEYDTGA